MCRGELSGSSTPVASYHHFGMQGLDFVQRAQPPVSSLSIALGELGVGVVVDRIPRDHQTNRRHMQRSSVLCVGMAKFYHF